MRKIIIVFSFFLTLFFSYYILAQVDTACESECNREYESAKWECSRKYPGPLEKKNYENCMYMNENNYKRCMGACGTSF